MTPGLFLRLCLVVTSTSTALYRRGYDTVDDTVVHTILVKFVYLSCCILGPSTFANREMHHGAGSTAYTPSSLPRAVWTLVTGSTPEELFANRLPDCFSKPRRSRSPKCTLHKHASKYNGNPPSRLETEREGNTTASCTAVRIALPLAPKLSPLEQSGTNVIALAITARLPS